MLAGRSASKLAGYRPTSHPDQPPNQSNSMPHPSEWWRRAWPDKDGQPPEESCSPCARAPPASSDDRARGATVVGRVGPLWRRRACARRGAARRVLHSAHHCAATHSHVNPSAPSQHSQPPTLHHQTASHTPCTHQHSQAPTHPPCCEPPSQPYPATLAQIGGGRQRQQQRRPRPRQPRSWRAAAPPASPRPRRPRPAPRFCGSAPGAGHPPPASTKGRCGLIEVSAGWRDRRSCKLQRCPVCTPRQSPLIQPTTQSGTQGACPPSPPPSSAPETRRAARPRRGRWPCAAWAAPARWESETCSPWDEVQESSCLSTKERLPMMEQRAGGRQ